MTKPKDFMIEVSPLGLIPLGLPKKITNSGAIADKFMQECSAKYGVTYGAFCKGKLIMYSIGGLPGGNVQIKGKHAIQLACGEIKYRKHDFSKQYQASGNLGGKRLFRIGSLKDLTRLMDKWRSVGATNLILAERIEDETGLNLIEMR